MKVYMAEKESSLAVFSTDMGHMFAGDVRKVLGTLICGKTSHEPNISLRYCLHPFTHDLH